MNKNEFGKWMRQRRIGRYALYIELVYCLILLFTLIFDFAVFMHLIAFQAVAIVLYLLVGWIYDAYDKSRRQKLVEFHKRDTLLETITSIRLNKLFFLRLFEVVIFFASLAVMAVMIRPIFAYLFQNMDRHANEALITFNLYANFFYVLINFVIIINLLGGKKKVILISSILEIILSVILIFSEPAYLPVEIVGLLVGISGVFVSRQAKI